MIALLLVVAACGDDGGDGSGGTATPSVSELCLQTFAAATPGPASLLEISANSLTSFNVDALEAPAAEPLSVTFDNQDSGVQHNFALYEDEGDAEGGAKPIAATELEPGPDSQTVDVCALAAGAYYFHCDVHPNMNGTLTLE